MADLLVLTGNCQAQYLAAVLDGLAGAQAIYYGVGYGTVPSFEGRLSWSLYGARFRGVVKEARARGDRIMLIEQRTPVADPPDLKLDPAFTVAFPHLICYALYPAEFCRDHGLPTAPNPRRLWSLDLNNMAKGQERSAFTIDIAGYCEEHFRKEVLFNTPGHPTGPLNALLVHGVLVQLASFDPRYGGSDLAERVRRHEGVNWVTSHPVAPDVEEKLDLDWGKSYHDFCRLIRACWTEQALGDEIPVLIARVEQTYAQDSIYWFWAAAIWWQRRNSEAAIQASRIGLGLSPGHGQYWLGLQTRLLQSGFGLQAESLLDEVRRVFGNRFEADAVLATLYNNLGRYHEALPLAINHFYNYGYNPEPLQPIAHALTELGRFDEIHNYARMTMAHYPGKTGQVEQILAPYAERVSSFEAVQARAVS